MAKSKVLPNGASSGSCRHDEIKQVVDEEQKVCDL